MSSLDKRLNKRIEQLEKEYEAHDAAQRVANRDVWVEAAMRNAYTWFTKHTRTRNEHWKDEGRSSPYEPAPGYRYLEILLELIEQEQIVWIEKSRDLMISWCLVAYFTFNVMKVPGRGVLFQTQKQEKANDLVGYAKCLYREQDRRLKDAFPLAKLLELQPANRLDFANGSYIVAIPAGADQIRSFHPWGLLNDETAFQPEAQESYNEAVPAVTGKIILNSSAGPSWFADAKRDIFRNESADILPSAGGAIYGSRAGSVTEALATLKKLPAQNSLELMQGLTIRRTSGGILVARTHYSCHPERNPEQNPEWKRHQRRKYTSQAAWDREQEIVDEAGGGELVFADTLLTHWKQIIIEDPFWQPELEWEAIGGFDYGKTNPTVLLRGLHRFHRNYLLLWRILPARF